MINEEIRSRIFDIAVKKYNINYLAGFADLSHTIGSFQYRSPLPVGISIALALPAEIIRKMDQGPTKEYYNIYYEFQKILDETSIDCMEFIQRKGYHAIAQTTDYVSKYLTVLGTSRTLLPLKTIAVKAGIGWIGKNDLLVTKKYGSAVRLTSVLTDAPLSFVEEILMPCRGECKKCQDICPVQAIKGIRWTPETDRDEMVDYIKCREAARKLSLSNFGIEVSLCGTYFYVCPYAQNYIKRS